MCVNVWDRVGEDAMRVLKRVIVVEKAKAGRDSLFPEPLLVYGPQRWGPEFLEDYTLSSCICLPR